MNYKHLLSLLVAVLMFDLSGCLQDDIRRVSRELEKSGSEKDDLTSKIEELNLYNDSSERELKKIITSKQDLMVDQNILKLELKRLRDMLNERADEVFSLEKRRLQLETVSSLYVFFPDLMTQLYIKKYTCRLIQTAHRKAFLDSAV